ncbi:hypothetical protein QQ045_005021 [Rhodiola kirilowii]
MVSLGSQDIEMNLINVYAPSAEKEKLHLWEELMELRHSNGGGWILGGDFNAVMFEEERRGSAFNTKEADMFFEFVQAMGVLDMPMIGRNFTWSNKFGATMGTTKGTLRPRGSSTERGSQAVGCEAVQIHKCMA